ncbi:MAG: hypothetical protein DRI89_08180 [Bacteroidetes bacterium]|nr:MAG: hypothetical protein DRI89_08180 [Bacteroidota bacterium]
MKTKKLILVFALLISGLIVSAQSYSDDGGKMPINHEQTSKPHIQISAQDVLPPDIITSFGNWMDLLKLMPFPGIGITIPDNSGTNNKDLKPQKEDRRTLPRLPGPYRYRSVDSRGNMNAR